MYIVLPVIVARSQCHIIMEYVKVECNFNFIAGNNLRYTISIEFNLIVTLNLQFITNSSFIYCVSFFNPPGFSM